MPDVKKYYIFCWNGAAYPLISLQEPLAKCNNSCIMAVCSLNLHKGRVFLLFSSPCCCFATLSFISKGIFFVTYFLFGSELSGNHVELFKQ